jgi:hypothetical protein
MKLLFISISFAFYSMLTIAQDTQSEFIEVADDNWHFETSQSGTHFTPFGTNYYDPESYGTHEVWDNPAFTAPNVIDNFDSTRTRTHFAQLQSLGANVIRIFLSCVKFEPTLYNLDESSFQKVDKIISLAKEYDLRIVFDLVEVWEGAPEGGWLSWDYYSDPVSIQGLEFLVSAFGSRYRDEPAIFAWDLTNEPYTKWSDGPMETLWIEWTHLKYDNEEGLRSAWPDYPLDGEIWDNIYVPSENLNNPNDQRLFDFQLFRDDVAYNWTKRLVEAIREVDQNHMITVGLIQWSIPFKQSIEGPGGYPGFNPQKIAPLLDYVSVHGYDWWDDYASIYIQGLLRYCFANKPVLLEEYQYHRSTVEATLGSASGWVNWAAYAGPDEADPDSFLIRFNGTINPLGTEFQSQAASIKAMTPEREPDAALMAADLKQLLTASGTMDELFNNYVTMQLGLSGPIGFNFINHVLPILFPQADPTALELPRSIELISIYPNPFTEVSTIEYQLHNEAEVRLEIYNVLGQPVLTLVNEKQSPGTYSAHWNGQDFAGKDVSAGIYFYRLKVNNLVQTKELVLLR